MAWIDKYMENTNPAGTYNEEEEQQRIEKNKTTWDKITDTAKDAIDWTENNYEWAKNGISNNIEWAENKISDITPEPIKEGAKAVKGLYDTTMKDVNRLSPLVMLVGMNELNHAKNKVMLENANPDSPVFKLLGKPNPDYEYNLVKGTISGASNTIGGIADLLGAESIGDEMNLVSNLTAAKNQYSGGNILSKDFLKDPEGLTYNLGNMAGSMLALYPSSMLAPARVASIAQRASSNPFTQKLVQTAIRGGLTSIPESMSEGGSVVREAKESGLNSPYLRGWATAGMNLPTLAASNAAEYALLGGRLFTPSRIAGEGAVKTIAKAPLRAAPAIGANMIQNGSEEFLQQAYQNIGTNQDYSFNPLNAPQNQIDSAILGGLLGGTMVAPPSMARALLNNRAPKGSDSVTDAIMNEETPSYTPDNSNSSSGNSVGVANTGNAEYDSYINKAANAHGVPANLIQSVMHVESGGNAGAVSNRGATGLMQLMPETAEAMGVTDINDPEQNIMGGAKYLRTLYDKYGNWDDALTAYNEGPGAFDEGKRYDESVEYAKNVLDKAGDIEDASSQYDFSIPTPIQDGIEDVGLKNTNPELKRGVDALNAWTYKNFGSQLTISGGWRSKEHNAEVNGSPTSHHLNGEAIDVIIPENFTQEQIEQIKEEARKMGFNSDGEDMYHDRGSGYHLHLTLPNGLKGANGGANFKTKYEDSLNEFANAMMKSDDEDDIDFFSDKTIKDDNGKLIFNPTQENLKALEEWYPKETKKLKQQAQKETSMIKPVKAPEQNKSSNVKEPEQIKIKTPNLDALRKFTQLKAETTRNPEEAAALYSLYKGGDTNQEFLNNNKAQDFINKNYANEFKDFLNNEQNNQSEQETTAKQEEPPQQVETKAETSTDNTVLPVPQENSVGPENNTEKEITQDNQQTKPNEPSWVNDKQPAPMQNTEPTPLVKEKEETKAEQVQEPVKPAPVAQATQETQQQVQQQEPQTKVISQEPTQNEGLSKEAKQQIAGEEPKAEPKKGKKSTVITDDGKELNTNFKIMDADELVTSHSAKGNFEVNPNYPKKLQPRNRERNVMKQQITEMTNKLRPEDLVDSRNVNNGAPIVDKNNVVLNGNGRSMAITRALKGISTRETTGKKYKEYLMDHAEEFGYSKEDIAKIKNPVLVRQVEEDLNDDEVKGVINSTSGGARMSASEQAKSDADKIKLGTLDLYVDNEQGDITTPANQEFVMAVLSDISNKNDLNALLDEKGNVNADGLLRVKRALFSLAYGDDNLIAKMSESTNDNIRNITNALLRTAPMLAKLNIEMKQGNKYKYSLAKDISSAVKVLSALRDSGQSVKNYLSSQNMFNEYNDSDEAKQILQFFDDNKRKSNIMAKYLSRAVNIINELGDPKQISMIETKNPTLSEILNRAANYATGKNTESNLFEKDTTDKTNDKVKAVDTKAKAEEPTDTSKDTNENKVTNEQQNEQAKNDTEEKESKEPKAENRQSIFGDEKEATDELFAALGEEQVDQTAQEKETAPKFVNVIDDSDENLERLKKEWLAELNNISANPIFNPKLFTIGLQIGMIYVQRGVNNFATWQKEVTKFAGDDIKPWLPALWNTINEYPADKKFDEKKMTAAVRYVGMQYEKGNRTINLVYTQFSARMKDKSRAKEYEPLFKAAYSGIKKFFDDMEKTQSKGEKDNGVHTGRPDSGLHSISGRERTTNTGENEGEGKSKTTNTTTDGTQTERSRGLDANATATNEPGKSNEGLDGTVQETSRSGNDSVGTDERKVEEKKPKEPLDTQTVEKVNKQPAKVNYHMSKDDGVGEGGEKTRYKNNIEAIKLLKQLEVDGRRATPKEQKTLAKYSGWGGLTSAFSNAETSEELKSLLTDEEFKAARASIDSAYYTAPVVVESIWKAVNRLGFKGGRILEPSMGVGNFFGLMPKSVMNKSTLTGVELDKISGQIATQLYQKANINIMGFEDIKSPDNFFDLAIGNVPFGSIRVHDPKFNKYKFYIHNYFFAKAIDKVRPGGLVVLITSSSTMDRPDGNSQILRTYLQNKADLMGAIRLPDTAFRSNTGTSVITDIIILKKRLDTNVADKNANAWENATKIIVDRTDLDINEYYANHSDMIAGRLDYKNGRYYGGEELVVSGKDINLSEKLDDVIEKLPNKIYEPIKTPKKDSVEATKIIFAPDELRENSYTIGKSGKVYQNINGKLKAIEGKKANVVKDFINLKNKLKQLLAAQIDNKISDAALEKIRAELNERYDTFVKNNGYLNDRKMQLALSDDPEYGLVSAVERYKEKKQGRKVVSVKAEKSDIFTKRTVGLEKKPTSADSAVDSLTISLREHGKVDIKYMANLVGKSEKEVVDGLKGAIYKDPITGEYETADEYLSGNVRMKLAQANEAAKTNASYKENVEALEKVQPPELLPEDITINLGASWVPASDIEQFATELTKIGPDKIKVQYLPANGEWSVTADRWAKKSTAFTETWGTQYRDFSRLLESALNQRTETIKRSNGDGKSVTDVVATTAVNDMLDRIKQEFKNWIWKDPARAKRLLDYYNTNFNNWRLREYDGSHLELPGYSLVAPKLRKHQKDAVWRIMQNQNTLLAHSVGAGKTWTMQTAAMEMRRLGICKKPVFVIPGHMIQQFENEWRVIYPNAELLVISADKIPQITKADMSNDNKRKIKRAQRERILTQIATEDWDGIIISHDLFERIAMSPEAYNNFYEEQLNQLEQAKKEINAKKGTDSEISDANVLRSLEKSKKSLEAKLKKDVAEEKKDIVISFEELGIDQIFVDEADKFKNLKFITNMQRISGISTTSSKRAMDMYLKTRYITKANGGRGVVFATGTPISNTLAEMFTMTRYMDEQALKDNNLSYFDNWANQFAEIARTVERNPDGNGYRSIEKASKFVNKPELIKMFRKFADVKRPEDLNLKIPKLKTGKRIVVSVEPSKPLRDFITKDIKSRAEAIRSRSVDPSVDNMLKLTGELRKASLDVRLMDPSVPESQAGSKIQALVDNVYKEYKESADTKGAQLIFCDLSTPKGNSGKDSDETEFDVEDAEKFDVYNAVKNKLIKKGIKANEIAFIHDANNKEQKQRLFDAVNEGDVRVLLGSTEKMGAGTNCQKKLVALHHLDCPWRPRDIEQREGRILRQGNDNKEVSIYSYVTKDSFDANMWEKIKNKQHFISEALSADITQRTIEDNDVMAMSFAEAEAIATGNPLMAEKVLVDADVTKYTTLKHAFESKQARIKRELEALPAKIEETKARLDKVTKDVKAHQDISGDRFKIKLGKKEYYSWPNAEKALEAITKKIKETQDRNNTSIGEIAGFEIKARFNPTSTTYYGNKAKVEGEIILTLVKNFAYESKNTIRSLVSTANNDPIKIKESNTEVLKILTEKQTGLTEESKRKFADEEKLNGLLEKQADLYQKLGLDENGRPIVDKEEASIVNEPQKMEPSSNIEVDNELEEATTILSIFEKMNEDSDKEFTANQVEKFTDLLRNKILDNEGLMLSAKNNDEKDFGRALERNIGDILVNIGVANEGKSVGDIAIRLLQIKAEADLMSYFRNSVYKKLREKANAKELEEKKKQYADERIIIGTIPTDDFDNTKAVDETNYKITKLGSKYIASQVQDNVLASKDFHYITDDKIKDKIFDIANRHGNSKTKDEFNKNRMSASFATRAEAEAFINDLNNEVFNAPKNEGADEIGKSISKEHRSSVRTMIAKIKNQNGLDFDTRDFADMVNRIYNDLLNDKEVTDKAKKYSHLPFRSFFRDYIGENAKKYVTAQDGDMAKGFELIAKTVRFPDMLANEIYPNYHKMEDGTANDIRNSDRYVIDGYEHTKTKEKYTRVKFKNSYDRDKFVKIKALAEQSNGMYSRFASGFLFPENMSDEELKSFFNAIDGLSSSDASYSFEEEMRKKVMAYNDIRELATMLEPSEITSTERELSNFGKRIGTPIYWFTAPKTFRGWHAHGTTYLNRNGNWSHPKVFWHETFHWIAANNPNLFKDMVAYINKSPITKKQLDAYASIIHDGKNKPKEKLIEEMMADNMMNVVRRTKFLRNLGKENQSLAKRFIGFIRDVMNRFVDYLNRPKAGLTNAQKNLMTKAFNNLALSIKDERGNSLFKKDSQGEIIINDNRDFYSISKEEEDLLIKIYGHDYENSLFEEDEYEARFSADNDKSIDSTKSVHRGALKRLIDSVIGKDIESDYPDTSTETKDSNDKESDKEWDELRKRAPKNTENRMPWDDEEVTPEESKRAEEDLKRWEQEQKQKSKPTKGVTNKKNEATNTAKPSNKSNGKITVNTNQIKENKIGLFSYMLSSPSRIAKRVPAFKPFFLWADNAMAKLTKNRSKYNKMLNDAFELASSKDDRDSLFELLWLGDKESREFGEGKKGEEQIKAIMDEANVNENVAKAYVAVRQTMNEVYNMLNDARKRAQIKTDRVSEKTLNGLKNNKFVKIMSSEKIKGRDSYIVTYKEYANWVKQYTVTKDELEKFRKDKNMQILEEREGEHDILNDENFNKDIPSDTRLSLKPGQVYTVAVRESVGDINRLKGYIPHFFHEWFVMVKEKGGGQYSVGSGRNIREAKKVAEEYLKDNPGLEIVIQPKQFDFKSNTGMDEDMYAAIVGDKEYYRIKNKIAKENELSMSEVDELLSGAIKKKNKHRFFGNLLKRTGAEGYEKNLNWVLRHYINSACRYEALETEFKPKALNFFERMYGRFDNDHGKNATAQYIKDYINDINGNPSSMELRISEFLNKNPIWNKLFTSKYGDRSALQVVSTLTGWTSVLKLGFLNVSSAALNLTQLLNSWALLSRDNPAKALGGLMKACFDLYREGKVNSLSADEKRAIEDAGVLDDIGLDSGAGYDKVRLSSRFTKYSMFMFKYTEGLVRRGTVLAAYRQARAKEATHSESVAYARDLNKKANFEYGVQDAPNIFRRGSVAAQLFLQFQKYPIKQFELMGEMLGKNTNLKQKMTFWGGYILLAGLFGLPAEDMFLDLIGALTETIWGIKPKEALKAFALDLASNTTNPAEKALIRTLAYGIWSNANIDLTQRFGMADIVPSTGPDYNQGAGFATKAVSAIFGPAGSTVAQTLSSASQRDVIGTIRAISPGLANIAEASVGNKYDKRGRIASRYDDIWSRLVHGMGFRTLDESLALDAQSLKYYYLDKDQKKKRKAIDAFLDAEENGEPTAELRKELKDLGVKSSTVAKARSDRKKDRLERSKDKKKPSGFYKGAEALGF